MSGIVVAADNSSVKKATALPGLPPKFRVSKNFQLFKYVISAQPDMANFEHLFARIRHECEGLGRPCQIRVVDLRDEQHCFADGESVSWMDTDSDINLELYLRTNQLARSKIHFLQDRKSEEKPMLRDIYSVISERDFIAASGDQDVEYKNLPILNHGIPGAQFIDALIADFHAEKQLPYHVITDFHCKGGNTRSAFAAALRVLMILKEHNLIVPTKSVEMHLKEHLDEKSFSRLYPLLAAPTLERENSTPSLRSNRVSTLSFLSFTSSKTDEDGSSIERILARAEELEHIFQYIIDEECGFSAGKNWTEWHGADVAVEKLGSGNYHPFTF